MLFEPIKSIATKYWTLSLHKRNREVPTLIAETINQLLGDTFCKPLNSTKSDASYEKRTVNTMRLLISLNTFFEFNFENNLKSADSIYFVSYDHGLDDKYIQSIAVLYMYLCNLLIKIISKTETKKRS